ncbi:MAG: FAD-binding oxidoreductase [Actinomycetota bacterium]|nr:FAD-binding oxidoreductase [Actinomycetota bacterium]
MTARTRTDALEQLSEITGGHARAAQDADWIDSVDGMPVRWVASPSDTMQTSAVLRFASQEGITVVPRGTGSKLRWGARPERCDLVLDTTRLDGLVEHAAGDLVVVAGAGRRIADLQVDLAAAGQWLAVDPPRAGTLGGLVATASTGPTRFLHGAVRDLLIGSTMVRADGVVAKSGGKVVKNVAGYDIGKVLTGSFGTLGVITQVAFRLHPRPVARSWVTVPVGSPQEVNDLLQRVVHSHLVPSGVELDQPATSEAHLAVLLEGFGPGVAARTEAAISLLGPHAVVSAEPPQWWGAEPGGSWADPPEDAALLKVTHEIACVGTVLETVAAAASAGATRVHVRGSVGLGSLYVAVEGGTTGIPELVGSLRGRARSFGGAVVVLEAAAKVKDQVDVWGPVEGLTLMRSLKQQFDPGRLLSPGRFVGGI